MKINKKIIVITIVSIILVGIPLGIYDGLHGNFIRDYLMEKRVKEHLLHNGYEEKEILSIEAEYSMKLSTRKIKGTAARVVFKDEPDEKYLYIQWRKSGKVQQECSYYNEATNAYTGKYTEKRKHMIENCY